MNRSELPTSLPSPARRAFEAAGYTRQKCGTGPDPSSDESTAIEVVKPDGTGLHEIVAQGGVRSHLGSQLSWSPDGSEILFGSQDGDLYLVHPDGTGLTHIPIDYGDARHLAAGPDWSPDGRLIVFSLYLGSRNSADLYVVAPDGSGLTRITDTLGAENWPRWGPGRRLTPPHVGNGDAMTSTADA